MRARLSLLMFLQYAPQGAFVPLFSLHLKELGFTHVEIGWACATQALAALVAPLVAGQVADRWFPAQQCLAVCAVLAGVMLWLLAGLTSWPAVFAASLAFWLVMGPVNTLGTALSFAHLADPARDFGAVRLWGTVGWAAAGWLLRFADGFALASLLAFLLGGYALTLPRTPPQRNSGAWLAPVAALRLQRGRVFVVFWACVFGVCVTLPFHTQVTPLLLADQVPREWLGPFLTLSQSMEIVSLLLLPVLLLRLGLRGTMLLGLLAWAALLSALTMGEPLWLVICALPLNGLCISGFIVAGQMFVNSRARGDLRASAQALLTWITGLGMLLGHLLVGWVRRTVDGAYPTTFGVGAVIALALVGLFFAGFREVEPAAEDSAEGKAMAAQPAVVAAPTLDA